MADPYEISEAQAKYQEAFRKAYGNRISDKTTEIREYETMRACMGHIVHQKDIHGQKHFKETTTAYFAQGSQFKVLNNVDAGSRFVGIKYEFWWEYLASIIRHFCPQLDFGWLKPVTRQYKVTTKIHNYKCYNVIPTPEAIDRRNDYLQIAFPDPILPFAIDSSVWLESEPATPMDIQAAIAKVNEARTAYHQARALRAEQVAFMSMPARHYPDNPFGLR